LAADDVWSIVSDFTFQVQDPDLEPFSFGISDFEFQIWDLPVVASRMLSPRRSNVSHRYGTRNL